MIENSALNLRGRFEAIPLSSWLRMAAVALIVFGIGLRFLRFGMDNSITYDEAMLALNIRDRSFSELLLPLSDNQGAPAGFLYAVKLITLVFGEQDFILRLIPLLAGCLSVVLMYRLTNRLIGQAPALVATGLFAFSFFLVFYTTIFKPYASDVLVVLILTLEYLRYLDKPIKLEDFLYLGLLGGTIIWFSFSALFIVAGFGLTLAVGFLVRKQWRQIPGLALTGTIWLVSLGSLYFLSLRHLAANSGLREFWLDAFMPIPPWEDPAWFVLSFANFRDLLHLPSTVFGLALFGLGAGSLLARRLQAGMLVLFPIGLTMIASGFQLYPFHDRFLLFLVPNILTGIAAGIELIQRLLNRRVWLARITWAALTGVLLFQPARIAAGQVVHPTYIEHIKPMLAYLAQHKQEGDMVYLYYGSYYAYMYYAPYYGLNPQDVIVGIYAREESKAYRKDLNQLLGSERVWVLFTHIYKGDTPNEERFFVRYMDRLGAQQVERRAPGAALYLYDFTPKPED